MERRIAKEVKIGNTSIGGTRPILVQSMTNTDTRNVKETVRQISRLQELGCELIRVAVPDEKAAHALKQIKENVDIPLIADIHFDYKLALLSLEYGADKLRINPGNIGKESYVKLIAKEAADRGIPIRIGVNSGSLEKELVGKYGRNSAKAMVVSAMKHIRFLEMNGFTNIVLSLKSSHVITAVRAYKEIAALTEYPLHIGITEAGTRWAGSIRSAVGLGAILSAGIGDTVRVSLTAPPEEEIKVAYEILKAMELRSRGPVIISCPTCGRCEIDVMRMAEEVEAALADSSLPLRIAVMGCVVNGPGEAADADFGIAGGKGEGVVFSKGKIIKKLPQYKLTNALLAEIKRETEA